MRGLAKHLGISYPLASDTQGQVGALYDVRRRFGPGNHRVTYVIDGEGIIRDVHRNELSVASHWRRALLKVKNST